jgi:hypothetical protein
MARTGNRENQSRIRADAQESGQDHLKESDTFVTLDLMGKLTFSPPEETSRSPGTCQ